MLSILTAIGVTTASLANAAPPETRVDGVKEVLHGVEVVDNYRWLEGDNSDPKQMGRVNAEVSAWTDAQNAYTRNVLDNLPGRKALEDRIRPLMEIGSVSAPGMRGNRYFYTRREGKENQPRVFVREGSRGADRLLLDPAQIDPTGLTALSGLSPSQDGKLLAFGLYRAGDENTTTYVMNVETGEWLADQIAGKSGIIEWLKDGSGFFYRNLENVNDPYSAQIMFHRLGTHQRMDKRLFRQYTKEQNAKLATTWGPGAGVCREAKWMILTYWTGTSSNDIWAVDLAKWWKDGTFEPVEIKVGANATFGGEVEGDTLYMVTDYNAPNKKVVAVDLKNPAEQNWKVVIPESKTAVLTGIGMAKSAIIADYEERASSKIRLYGRDGSAKGEMKLPGIGSGGLSVEHDRDEAYLTFTSYNFPTTIFQVDVSKPSADPAVWERPDVPVDPTIAEVKQVEYKSKDGTTCTMFLVHRKGLDLNKNNPTLLYGYGGFNISMTPGFSPTLFPWIEDGGVYAVANLRGGGEYGKKWREDGMLEKKQNVYDDFYAAAEWLIANNYTRPEKLAVMGGSNGGLLTGVAVTQRPELFRAAIVAVPLLDMLRYQYFLMARYWVPEYGDPENADAFRWIKAYSPYHNVKSGTAYPAVLVTAGENDTRVHALHARKFGAALQAATTNSPDEKPVLVWVDRDSGHGQGKPLNLRLRDQVDTRIFLMWQLGMLEKAEKGAMLNNAAPNAAVVRLSVKGMKCEMCAEKVRDRLQQVKGVRDVEIDVKKGSALVTADDVSPDAVRGMLNAFQGTEFSVAAAK